MSGDTDSLIVLVLVRKRGCLTPPTNYRQRWAQHGEEVCRFYLENRERRFITRSSM
jgi:hypothetical protein